MRFPSQSPIVLACLLVAMPGAPCAAAPQAPDSSNERTTLGDVLAKVGEYCSSYRRRFRQFVADEARTEALYNDKGKVTKQRAIRSDYYVVELPSKPDQTLEFRETLEVDGKPVERTHERVLDLLNRKSPRVGEEFRRLFHESNKYNLDTSARMSNVVLSLLGYLTPKNQARSEYQLGPVQGGAQARTVVLQFRETAAETLFSRRLKSGTYACPASGEFLLALPGAEIVRLDVTVNCVGALRFRYHADYEAGPEGILLPARLSQSSYSVGRSERLLLASDSRYSNYRRFQTDVKLDFELPGETTAPAKPPQQ